MIHPVFWGHDLRVTNLFFFWGRNGLTHVDTTKREMKLRASNFNTYPGSSHTKQEDVPSRNSDVVFQGHPRQAACVAVVWLRG